VGLLPAGSSIVLRAPHDDAGATAGRRKSRAALHPIAESCCEQVRGIASARAYVTRKGKTYHTELRLKIRPDAKLDAIQGYLTQEITEIYHQNLGLKDIGEIEIKVVGVVPSDQTF
jgi:hypothetical protein